MLTNDDLISRKAILALVTTNESQLLDADALYMEIQDLPSAELEQKKAKWRTVTPISYKYEAYRCSECNELVYGKTNYCPCCGSYMGAYTRGGCHGDQRRKNENRDKQ